MLEHLRIQSRIAPCRVAAVFALLWVLCAAQTACGGTKSASKVPDKTGASTPKELVAALNQSCLRSDFAKLVALVAPGERADMAGNYLAMSSMECAMMSAMAGMMPSDPNPDLNIQGLSSMQAGCKGMTRVAARYGTPFELWEGAMAEASEQERGAGWKKARKSLDALDVSALVRDLQDERVKAHAPVKQELPCFGHGVDVSRLHIQGDTGRVPVREATGYFALVRSGGRWYFSLERSDPGQTNEQLAAQRVEQAGVSDLKALRDAAHGTWEGPWGRLVFRADGTATLDSKAHCASETERPWQALPGSCKPLREEGKVELSPYEIALGNDGLSTIYSAYVDAAGRLHLAQSQATVGNVDDGRNGQVKLDMFRTLHVQGGSCRVEDSMKETNTPVACAYTQEDGLDLLRADFTLVGEKGPTWLVHLPQQGLLVPPDLYAVAFDRASEASE